MLGAGDLTEVAHVEAEVALAIDAQDPLQFVDGHPPQRGDLPAAIEQAVIAVAGVVSPQATDRARAHPEHLPHLRQA
jgi:hypothetical protein